MKNEQLLRIAERLLPYTADFPEPVRELFVEFVMTGEYSSIDDDNFDYNTYLRFRNLLRLDTAGNTYINDRDLPLRYHAAVALLYELDDSADLLSVPPAELMDQLEKEDPR